MRGIVPANNGKIECKDTSIWGFCVEQEWGFWCSSNVSSIKREAEGEMKSLMDNNWDDKEDLEVARQH